MAPTPLQLDRLLAELTAVAKAAPPPGGVGENTGVATTSGDDAAALKQQVEYLSRLLLTKEGNAGKVKPPRAVVQTNEGGSYARGGMRRGRGARGARNDINNARGFSRILMGMKEGGGGEPSLGQGQGLSMGVGVEYPTGGMMSARSSASTTSSVSVSRSEGYSEFKGGHRGRNINNARSFGIGGGGDITGFKAGGRVMVSYSAGNNPTHEPKHEYEGGSNEESSGYSYHNGSVGGGSLGGGNSGGSGYNAALSSRLLRVDRASRHAVSDSSNDNIKQFFNTGGAVRGGGGRKMSLNMVETMKKVYLDPKNVVKEEVKITNVAAPREADVREKEAAADTKPSSLVVDDMAITDEAMAQVAKYFGVDDELSEAELSEACAPNPLTVPSADIMSPIRTQAARRPGSITSVGLENKQSWSPPFTPGGEGGASVDDMIQWVGTLNDEELEV